MITDVGGEGPCVVIEECRTYRTQPSMNFVCRRSPQECDGRLSRRIMTHLQSCASKPTTARDLGDGPEVSGGSNMKGAGRGFQRLFLLAERIPHHTFHLDEV